MNKDERKARIQELIARGKEQGYLTFAEVNDHLPDDIVDSDQIEDIVNMINAMGINVLEKAPDADELVLSDDSVSDDDDDAAEEAAAALASVDSEFGRTTDPVRMYMREMGTVELLTREGEIRIAKRIEEGLNEARIALAHYPATIALLLAEWDLVKAGETRLAEVIAGFHGLEVTDPEAYAAQQAEQAEEESDEDDDEDEGEKKRGNGSDNG